MRCKVIKHAVDGVAVGGVVELVDNVANRALIDGGVIEPLYPLPPRPPPKAPKAPSKSDTRDLDKMRAEFSEAWEGAQRELAELRAQLADVTAQRDDLAAERDALRAQVAQVAAGKSKGKKGDAPTDPEKTEG